GFGPLFILCLLFQATKSLFSKWLLYGLGTMFSLSVLTFTVSLATKVVGAVGVAFLAKWALNGGNGEGISSMALQQGGLGLVLTTLIITAPPMAAAFFQGTLGQFTAYSALGQLDRASQEGGAGRPYVPGAPNASDERKDARIASQHTVHNAPTDPGHTPLTTGSKGAHSDRIKT
ncbi:type IV secretion system protein, partial [Xanthomonas arboricola]|uniref:type IV secretion system protein n=2 Tax=Xanthomonas TaxID=338 RepID=UPI000D442A60